VTVLAVALTLGGGAAVGGLAGQVALPAGTASVTASAVVIAQVRALGVLARKWQTETEDASQVMETLKASEEKSHADGAEVDP
jgi:hypothetical protein